MTCSPQIAEALGKLPPETWSFDAGAPPADRAALEQAGTVSYTPATGKVEPLQPSWFVARKLAARGGCEATPTDVIVARVATCQEIASGRGYRGPDGQVTAVNNARCDGALVWVQRSTGKVLAKAVGTSSGNPLGMTDKATDSEVRGFAGRGLEIASITLDEELAKGVAAWSPQDRAIHDAILAEERARRLQGVDMKQECIDNPLASGCL